MPWLLTERVSDSGQTVSRLLVERVSDSVTVSRLLMERVSDSVTDSATADDREGKR